MKKDFAFGVIVFYEENGKVYFLVLQQVQGHWSFPKGHAEEGESKLETALRELKEETGIDKVELISNNVMINEEYVIKKEGKEDIHKTVEFFIGETSEKNILIQENEIFDHKWITVDDDDSLTYESSKRIINKANQLVRNYLLRGKDHEG